MVASRSAAEETQARAAPEFGRLPATAAEIAAIAASTSRRRFPGAKPLTLGQGRATEAALREDAATVSLPAPGHARLFRPAVELRSALGPSDPAARPRTDLFGARGVAGFHPGLLSGLALTGANVRPTPLGKDDGILTALEVAELDLSKVELAVLSACETGLGEVAGGEGLLGLQRAFQVAGRSRWWPASGRSATSATQDLMARFYENLWRHGPAGPRGAAAAQLHMLREGYRRGMVPLPADTPRPERDRGVVPLPADAPS